MKILFDFRSYQISAQRGIGRYFLSLYEHLIKYAEVEASLLLTKNEKMNLPSYLVDNIPLYLLEDFDNYEIEENFDFLFKGNFFDLHDNMVSLQYPKNVIEKCNQIVGIAHDVIPLVFANNYLSTKIDAWKYCQALETMNLANYLFANSKATKNDISKLAGYPEKNISVIYGGADKNKFHTENSDKPYKHEERENHIVFVAGDDLRKNFTGAARAFAMAYERMKLPKDAKLYLVCKSSPWFVSKVEQAIAGYTAQIGKQIIVTGYIEDDKMLKLYSTAKASIFPSFYEGLGLPILESYIAGTPCFASNLSSTKEFVPAECAFDPYDDESVAETIVKIFNDADLCKYSLDFGRRLLKEINWDNAAKITIEKLRELQKTNSKCHKVAVFSCLPPSASGIAAYSYNLHTLQQDRYDLISDISCMNDYMALLNENVVLSYNATTLHTQIEGCLQADKGIFVCQNFKERNIVSYGPYISLNKGKYKLEIDYELSKNSEADFRLTANCGKLEILSGNMIPTKRNVAVDFELSEGMQDVEVQTFFVGKGRFVLKEIRIIMQFKSQSLPSVTNVIPYSSYPYMHLTTQYDAKIFVIGNSEHHNTSLQEAIKSKGEDHRLLYLHEGFILFAFYPMLNFDLEKIKEFIICWYPHLFEDVHKISSFEEIYGLLRKHHIGGVRPLLELTGIDHIVVNNEKAKELIEAELTWKNRQNVRIDVLFHPIPNLATVEPINLKRAHKEYIIGSFGMPSITKCTDKLILAVQELNRRGYCIKLLLAGYKADQWLKDNRYNAKDLNIETIENPNDEMLLALMKSVDLAVQLRLSPHGESSGCVAQLLGMNQKILTNKGFVSSEVEEYCTLVPEDCTIEELKQGILSALSRPLSKNELANKYSYANLSDKLYKLAIG